MKVKLISDTKNLERNVATAGKICYSDSKGEDVWNNLSEKDIDKFISMLISMDHMSPLEHASFTFIIEGVSRSLLAQLTRHRIASFSVQSQRYVNMDDKFEPIHPSYIKNNEVLNLKVQKFMDDTKLLYSEIKYELMKDYFIEYALHEFNNNGNRELSDITIRDDFNKDIFMNKSLFKEYIDPLVEDKELYKRLESYIFSDARKFAIENARCILPNACPTQLIMTMNARELIHFFKLRCCNRAQDEIKELAWRILNIVKSECPSIFKFAGPSCLHGSCNQGKFSCGQKYSCLIHFM